MSGASSSPHPEKMGREEIERRITASIGAALAIGPREIRAPAFVLTGSRFFSSFALLELILRLEEAFGIEIPDHDLDGDRFDSLRSIADYVEHRLGRTGSA